MEEHRQVPSKRKEETAGLIHDPLSANSSKYDKGATALWYLRHRELTCYPKRVPKRTQKRENLLYI